ncbi:cell wall metabolism sensor histidine kinase WalK [uncultured Selenomonas sp.]|uniref:sensor histidine kinase n=1 Tax=uncultured Selenomonas sp. TaxID=159275 RepID=UPI0025D29785|nr:HAMP domain-containing sensor histidine kinase [uncultured Selenomonas sp.]
MFHVRDISLERRILTTNFLMVFIPALLLFVAGFALLGALRLAGTARQNDFAALFPTQGPALSIQYAIDELRYEADHHKTPRLKSFEDPVAILEKEGIAVSIASKDGTIYVTPGTSAEALQNRALPKDTLLHHGPMMMGSAPMNAPAEHHDGAMHHHDAAPPMMPESERPHDDDAEQLLWTRDGVYFAYTSPVTGTTIRAAGALPFLAQERLTEGPAKHLIEALLLVIVGSAILFIVFLGLYLSRLLTEQILGPLDALRAASARIKGGDLDTPMDASAMRGDEMGAACRDFDAMRAELRDARDERARYDAQRKELIAGISHDLATPLTLLKGYADGLLAGLATTEGKRAQYAQRIAGAATSMERLVNNLRMFSRLELGRMPLHPEPVALVPYFEDCVSEQKDLLADRGLRLTLDTQHADATAAANIDRDAFARVIDNLFGNAIKYKETDTIAMDLIVRTDAENARLTFADHGPGVPESALPHLFELFYRTDAARTDTKKGSGLGLAICREIVTGLGGEISASTTDGGGLTITIELPILNGGLS